MTDAKEHIILFDGVCNLCDGFVRFVIRHDKSDIFRFAPLQSNQARHRITTAAQDPSLLENKSVIYLEGQQIWTRSEAVLRACEKLGGIWAFLSRALRIFPAAFRDWVYDQVAGLRYRLFGKKHSCGLVPAHLRHKFLTEN